MEQPAPHEPHDPYERIPPELRQRPQWAVWRRGPRRADGRYDKLPYTPQTGALAKSNDPSTWGSYEQAVTAYAQQGYAGIGYMLMADDPFVVVDIDHCRHPATGELTPDAFALVARLDSYTEVSPSGTGAHIFVRATPPTSRNVVKPYEVYVANHFITLTGQHVTQTPATIEDRQQEFGRWYQETFGGSPESSHPTPDVLPTTTDEAILHRVQRSPKAAKLWAGDASGYGTPSEADAALLGCLARWTQDPDQLDRLFRHSGLYRSKWDREDYAERTIRGVLATVAIPRRSTPRREQRITYTYDWQRRDEAPGERDQYLRRQAEAARDAVRQHIIAGEEAPLVITLAPGVGKTHVVAELGNTHDLAWIGPRHDLYGNVATVAPFRHIQPCTPANCPDADQLNLLAHQGYNVLPMHRRHACDYYRQFDAAGSAYYQVAHVPTAFPKQHAAAIVDEFDVSAWLEDRDITLGQVTEARLSVRWSQPDYEPVADLLRALSETMVEAGQRGVALHGKALMDTLERHCGGALTAMLDHISRLWVMDERPKVTCDVDVREAEAHGKVIVPFIVAALREDLPKWRRGGDWNSRTHISASEHDVAMHILTPRQFRRDTTPWPYAILDATADEDLLVRIVGHPVTLQRHDITPPPQTRHIAVRIRKQDGSLKRYSKRSLAGWRGMGDTERQRVAEEQERVVRAISHVLERERLLGRTMGLITFQDCEDALGEALGIPEERRGHFWAERGSNDFEGCEVLLVVGTPTQNLKSVEWMARALYTDDPTPIDITQEGKRYRDPRLARLLDYLVNAELTQVAHRNRPIRHDGRVVITFTSGDVDFLPVTEMITAFPDLPTQKRLDRKAQSSQEQEERLERAYEAFIARQETVTVRTLARAARVKTQVAGEWLRGRREQEERFPKLQ